MWKKCNWFRSLFLPNAPLQYTPQWLEIKQERFLIRELELGDIKELLAVQRLTYDGQTPWTRSGFLSELYSRYTHLYLGVVHEEKVIGFMGGSTFFRRWTHYEYCHYPEISRLGTWRLFITRGGNIRKKPSLSNNVARSA